MNKLEMSFSEIQPFIRYVQCVTIGSETYPTNQGVYPYDCRFFYVKSGYGTLSIGGTDHPLIPMDAFLYQSGCLYNLSSNKEDPLVLLGVNFDFTQNHATRKVPIPPVPKTMFSPGDEFESITFTDFEQFSGPIHLKDMRIVEEPLQKMLREYKAQKLFCSIQLTGLFADILVTTCRRLAVSAMESRRAAIKMDSVINYIHEHFSDDISNESLGQIFGYHPNYLNRQIKLYTGKPLHQYLIQYRLSRAVDLILATDISIGNVADRVGFHDVCHFNRLFKKIYGIAPSHFRNS